MTAMQAALSQLPSALAQAWQEDWSPCRDMLQTADHLYTVGRGLHLGIAQEAAHKLKETCMIHAEAYSSAEVLHGPNELAGKDFPVLLFRSEDATDASVQEAARRLGAQGASVMMAGGGDPGSLACAARAAPGACTNPSDPGVLSHGKRAGLRPGT